MKKPLSLALAAVALAASFAASFYEGAIFIVAMIAGIVLSGILVTYFFHVPEDMAGGKLFTKVRVYRFAGWALILYGMLSFLAPVTEEVQNAVKDPYEAFFRACYTGALTLALNVFIYGGMAFHWQADRNQHAGKSSKWGKALICYLIFTAVVYVAWQVLLFFSFIPSWALQNA